MEKFESEGRDTWGRFRATLMKRLGLVELEMGPTTDLSVEPEGIEFYVAGSIRPPEDMRQEEVK